MTSNYHSIIKSHKHEIIDQCDSYIKEDNFLDSNQAE